jgi:hypothetical protein
MEILYVYDDGAILTPEVFNQDPEALLNKIRAAAANLTAISLEIGQPNALSVPHMISNAFKNIASIALGSDIPLKILDQMKSNAPAKTTAPAQTKKEAAPVVEQKKPVEEEEPAVDMGGMFGDDDF